MGKRRLVVAGTTGVLALVTVVGCGGSGASIPFSMFEASAEQAVCHVDVLCGTFPDQATCLASVQVKPHYYETVAQDIGSGKVVYDGAKARTCLDMLNALSSCNRTSVPRSILDVSCNRIFTGTVAIGGPCFVNEECAEGSACQTTASTCDSFSQCCAGTCVAVPAPAPVGGDCTGFLATCVAGATCATTPGGTTLTCQMNLGAGGDCSGQAVCGYPLYCEPTTRTCKSPVGTGGACNPALGSQDCDSPGDRCNAQTSTCTPLLPVGSACDASAGRCVSYASCDATTNTCVKRPAVGAACDATGTGPSCLGGSCDATTATCTLVPTSGSCS